MAVGFLSRAPAEGGAAPGPEVYAFGPFVLDVARHALTRDGQPVTLTPKGFELLLVLLRSGGRVLSRQELIAALWPDTFVEEGNLSFQMSALRKALGGATTEAAAAADGPEAWIETVPKVGYRFTADVVTASPDAGGAVRRRTTVGSVTVMAVLGAALVIGAIAWAWTASERTGETRNPYGTTAVPLTSYPGWEMSPSLSPDGTQVAFNWDGADRRDFDIYVKLVGDGEPLRMTDNPRHDVAPAWSPDGSKIAFLRVPVDQGPWDLIVIPALGGTERLVASMRLVITPIDHRDGAFMSWTPDGRWLTVGANVDGEWGIWLVEVDGPGRRRLTTPPPGRVDRSPLVAADATRVAFIRGQSPSRSALLVQPLGPDLTPRGDPQELIDPWPRHIAWMAWGADRASLVYSVGGFMGTSRMELMRLGTHGVTAPVHELLPFGEQATGLSIAVSGRMVYARQQRDTAFWTLDLENPGRGPVESPVSSSLDESTPHVSPDGRRLVFASTRSGTQEIWIADVDGSHARQLTTMNGPECWDPQWAPDGRQIVFSSTREGSSDLYVLDPANARIRRLTTDPGWEGRPKWSRDGRWIYYARVSDGIWRVSPDGGAAEQVTTSGGLSAQESPDRRALYVTRPNYPVISLWRVPLDGGPESLVAEDVAGPHNVVVGRQSVYFLAIGHTFTSTSVAAVDIDSGRRTTLAPFGKPLWWGMTLSPDERWLLLSGVIVDNIDLMVVDPPS